MTDSGEYRQHQPIGFDADGRPFDCAVCGGRWPCPAERPRPRDGEYRLPLKNDAELHTSGVMRCRFEVLGGHVHCAVFGPFSGKAGDLIFRVEEWDHFQRTHPNWQFAARDNDGKGSDGS